MCARLWLLCTACFCCSACFVPSLQRSPIRPSLSPASAALCLRRSADELWKAIEVSRLERDRIKLDIVEVIQRQRECKEGSLLYGALEKRFMELLQAEDEAVLGISRLVSEMVESSRLDRKNATGLYRSYFKDV